MTDAPKIPFGYKAVTGQSRKGDGYWDGEKFRKVRKMYPTSYPTLIIRKCDATQTVMPTVAQPVWED